MTSHRAPSTKGIPTATGPRLDIKNKHFIAVLSPGGSTVLQKTSKTLLVDQQVKNQIQPNLGNVTDL